MKKLFLAILAGLTLAAVPASAQLVYGIGSDGHIYGMDLTLGTTTSAFTTGFTAPNAFSFDYVTNTALYRSTSSGALNLWNATTNSQVAVGGTALTGSAADASFYNGSYWYVGDSSDTLYRVNLNLSNLAAPTVTSVTPFANFDGTSKSAFSFGDIAITASGILYGWTSGGDFFSVDLSSGTPTGYQAISSLAGVSLQIGYDEDGALYGVKTSDGTWYNINTANGTLTNHNVGASQMVSTGVSLNDIGNAVPASVVPEPSEIALLAIGGVVLWLTARRRVLA